MCHQKNRKKRILFISSISFFIFLIFLIPSFVRAVNLGEIRSFHVDSFYDISDRQEISAILQRVSNNLYFYIDNAWWSQLSPEEKDKINTNLFLLSDEFERKIYPTLTSFFSLEWRPGIDNDEHITVLIHPMKKNRGGYFNNGDEYSKFLVPTSNEREMIYLNSDYITEPINKSFLAHEFMHLITFNQKEKIIGSEEEVWLNEARAEYVPTLLGYDSQFEGSNLQRRVKEFLQNPSDSITDWQGSSEDYGALNIFTQYLVDHYGVNILVDSLRSSKKGIESLNEALARDGFKEDFSQIFTDWTITVLVNDCFLGPKYCYKNKNLDNLRVVPVNSFLPLNSQSILSVSYTTKNWTGNWHRIFGGGGTLTFEFEGALKGNFKVPYIICDSLNVCSVKFLALDENQSGKIIIKDFNTKYASLTVIPSAQDNFPSSESPASSFSFSWKTRIDLKNPEEELINQLLSQIASLKAEIAGVQAQIDAILGKKTNSCQEFTNDLHFGMTNSQEVRCLQEFLKSQGSEIYPEGLVTGNFLSLTQLAVIRFQEKYASEILKPLGLEKGTGYIGAKTRAKISQLLGY
jgi:peptidoglycan hydrolase-like protein with peptidoglycan-binding domain